MKKEKNMGNFICKKIFFLIVIICLIVSLIFIYNKIDVTSTNGVSEETLSVDYSKYEEVGENAYISSVGITKTTTGVGPFDDVTDTDSQNENGEVTWTAGDDWSEDDNIVRSFDQITWTVESTFTLKSGAKSGDYTGGVICIKASISDDLEGLVEWDLDSMSWAENVTVSENGTELTAYYTMTETDKTVPGKQDLVLVLQVYGASNGTEITPSFDVSLYGNDENDVVEINGETIYVSATANYNIQLLKNPQIEKKVTVSYNNEDVSR